jgi:hypothetical protein
MLKSALLIAEGKAIPVQAQIGHVESRKLRLTEFFRIGT